jgi:hypothetical protein
MMPPADSRQPEGDESTGLPFFKTWRDVYWYVVASFVIVVLLLAIFTWTFTG